MVRQHIAEQLQRLRKQAGLTQAQLAKRLNVHWRSISDWERGATTVDEYKAAAILAIMKKLAVEKKGKGKGKQS